MSKTPDLHSVKILSQKNIKYWYYFHSLAGIQKLNTKF
jgi:hypothetical protein